MVQFEVYGRFGNNPIHHMGAVELTSKGTAMRDIATLLRMLADAMDEQATFEEIALNLRDDLPP